MARPVNKKATLKKQCKEYELSIKKSLEFQGINYHAKALKLDEKLKLDNWVKLGKSVKLDKRVKFDRYGTHDHILHCIQDAIQDVKDNAFEFIDDAFCKSHGLPNIDRFQDELSDAQALFISLIVSELYPDINDLLEKKPNTAELLFPALAYDKLSKTRNAIENDNFEEAELLIGELRGIAEMIVTVPKKSKLAPYYKTFNEEKKLHKEKVSGIRSKLVKKTTQYAFSVKLRALVVEYVKGVTELLVSSKLKSDPALIASTCLKGLEMHGAKNAFDTSLSILFSQLEDSYIALYEKEKLNKDADKKSRDEALDNVFLSPATIRRHVVDIVSQLPPLQSDIQD